MYRRIYGIWPLVGVVAILAPLRTVAGQRTVAGETTSDAAARALEALLSRRVSINVTGVPLERAIDVATSNARVLVQYEAQAVNKYGKSVTLRLTDVPLGLVLERMLAGTTLRVVPDGTTKLVIVEPSVPRQTQATGTIVGEVVDSSTGRGVARASVLIAGTKFGATTNAAGRFTIPDVPAGEHRVTVRVLGYRAASRPVTVSEGAEAAVRVALAPTATMLSDVVTTATGTQRKLEVGNDITTLNVDSLRRVAPITSVTDLLEARAPGVTVQRTSGTPGRRRACGSGGSRA